MNTPSTNEAFFVRKSNGLLYLPKAGADALGINSWRESERRDFRRGVGQIFESAPVNTDRRFMVCTSTTWVTASIPVAIYQPSPVAMVSVASAFLDADKLIGVLLWCCYKL